MQEGDATPARTPGGVAQAVEAEADDTLAAARAEHRPLANITNTPPAEKTPAKRRPGLGRLDRAAITLKSEMLTGKEYTLDGVKMIDDARTTDESLRLGMALIKALD